jgi:ABC-type polysaccharide/polyol phosphate transport system ATPase subunit
VSVMRPVLSLEHVSKDYPAPPPMRLRRFFSRFRGVHVEDGFATDALINQELDDDELMDEGPVEDEAPLQRDLVGRRVLDDVTLELEPGVVALVGPPGAGKTVLLKLAAGIVAPSEGRVVVRGSVAPALAVMATVLPTRGHSVKAALPQLAAMVGIPPHRVRRRFDAIVDLMASPQLLKSSTSLMESARKRELIVAMALALEPDILLLDMTIPRTEFGERCVQRIDELRTRGSLVVAETRDQRKLRVVPDRVMLIDRGRLLDDRDGSGALDSVESP